MAETARKSGGIGELIRTLVYALLLAGLIRTLIFQPFWIPSGSMKPSLLIGDFLFVNKFAYGYSMQSCPGWGGYNVCFFARDAEGRLFGSDPERGDIIVFRHPRSGQDYIKRLIGLPGDTIEVRGGQIILNGQPVPQTPDGQFAETFEKQGPLQSWPRCTNNPGIGASCLKDLAIETLPGGVTHPVLDFGVTAGDSAGPFTVPAGELFFMGDNRDNSLDSRFGQDKGGVGFVPVENVIGRADRIIFSSAGASILYFWTWRADRFFKAVE